jgi:hypothetical protein
MVNIDGVVGLMVFLVFVAWSFVYFMNVFSTDSLQSLDDVADSVSSKVAGYLTVDSYEMPVKHVSAGNASDAVLYLDYAWPSEGAKNSTRVYHAGSALPCNLTGDRLYWTSDVVSGGNHFTVRFSDSNGTANCTGGGLGGPLNKTIPMSAVKSRKLSNGRVSSMASMDYGSFRSALGIGDDFRVILNVSGTETIFGLSPPNASDVHVKSTRHATLDGAPAEIRVLVW